MQGFAAANALRDVSALPRVLATSYNNRFRSPVCKDRANLHDGVTAFRAELQGARSVFSQTSQRISFDISI